MTTPAPRSAIGRQLAAFAPLTADEDGSQLDLLEEVAAVTAPETPGAPCPTCGTHVHPLEVFPGGLCLPCYTPIGERKARTMTADQLTAMWGGPVRRRR